MRDAHASQEWEFRKRRRDDRGREVRLYRSTHNPQKYKRVTICTGALYLNRKACRFVCVQFATVAADAPDVVRWSCL